MAKRWYVHWVAGSRTPICSGPYSKRKAVLRSMELARVGIPSAVDKIPLDREAAEADEAAYLKSIIMAAENRALYG